MAYLLIAVRDGIFLILAILINKLRFIVAVCKKLSQTYK